MINKDLINDALWILSDYEGLRNYSVIEKIKEILTNYSGDSILSINISDSGELNLLLNIDNEIIEYHFSDYRITETKHISANRRGIALMDKLQTMFWESDEDVTSEFNNRFLEIKEGLQNKIPLHRLYTLQNNLIKDIQEFKYEKERQSLISALRDSGIKLDARTLKIMQSLIEMSSHSNLTIDDININE